MSERPAVLVIAGTDSSGGAGLVRDVMTLRDHGAEAMCAVTAVTAQTDRVVSALDVMPGDLVEAQIEAALASGRVRAIKIGMLGSGAVVSSVAAALGPASDVPIVLDPVLRSSSDKLLLEDEGIVMVRELLLAKCRLVTPNLGEAAPLAGFAAPSHDAPVEELAEALLGFGAGAVLIKGGHGGGPEAVDWLFETGTEPVMFAKPRLLTTMRGTGCALASAIAANLASGKSLKTACLRAKQYVFRQLLDRADRDAT